MKLSEAASNVISLARAIRAYWDRELPKRHPDYPVLDMNVGLGPPPPEELELREFLLGLSPEMIYKLLLIMHLGRGDYGVADLSERLMGLQTTFVKSEWAISQMMAKAPLADYMADGLEKLKHDGINPDKLFAKASKSRK